MEKSTKRIFLDTNHWITLAKLATGKEPDHILLKLYQKIKLLSDSGTAIFPISMFHLDDVMKRTDIQSRDTVIDVILDISKGWVMKPYLLFFKKEIENAVLNRLGAQSAHDVNSQIIGKGLAYTAGEEYRISSDNPEFQKFLDEHDEELRQFVDSPESMKKLLKDDSFAKEFKKWRKPYEHLAIQLEKNREIKRKMTKSQRYNYELGAIFTKTIVPHITKFFQESKIPTQNLGLTTQDDLNSFLDNMPAINVFFKLIFARDEDSAARKVQANDMIDISHLAGAIPYCDIVVTEKMFGHLSKQQKLGQRYNCIICVSLNELGSVLN